MTKQQRRDVQARQAYCKERDEAFLSLDEKKILAFCMKHNVKIPENQTAFWAGVHKAICNMNAASSEQKAASVLWLLERGFSPEIRI